MYKKSVLFQGKLKIMNANSRFLPRLSCGVYGEVVAFTRTNKLAMQDQFLHKC